jgi:hypothetical protein
MALGGFVAVTGVWWDWTAFLVGLPCGFAVAAVLTANNLCDIEDDRAAGVTTLAGVLGFARARHLYYAEVAAIYVSIALLVGFGALHPLCLVALVTVPLAWGRIRVVRAAYGPGDVSLEPVLQSTAMMHLAVGASLVATEAIGRGLLSTGTPYSRPTRPLSSRQSMRHRPAARRSSTTSRRPARCCRARRSTVPGGPPVGCESRSPSSVALASTRTRVVTPRASTFHAPSLTSASTRCGRLSRCSARRVRTTRAVGAGAGRGPSAPPAYTAIKLLAIIAKMEENGKTVLK